MKAPWLRAMQTSTDRRSHQRVISRMKLDLIDAPTKPVMRMKHRRIHVRQPRMRLHISAAKRRTQRG